MDKITLPASDFALTATALSFLQDSWAYLENIAKIAGDNVLISGGAVSSGVAASGIIYLNGSLMPFKGGTVQDNVRIVETTETITVDTGTRDQVTYYAEFGTSTDDDLNVAWDDITQIPSIKTILSSYFKTVDITEVEDVSGNDITYTVYSGKATISNNVVNLQLEMYIKGAYTDSCFEFKLPELELGSNSEGGRVSCSIKSSGIDNYDAGLGACAYIEKVDDDYIFKIDTTEESGGLYSLLHIWGSIPY